MPMTIVRDGDDANSIAKRLGKPTGAIHIDAVVVDAFAAVGVSAAALRDAILAHRPNFSRRKAPIDVPGSQGVELYGNLEGDIFSVDRMECGHVTYFSTVDDGIAHVADYERINDGLDIHPELATGRRLRDVVRGKAFRSKRSPRIASAEHRKGDALRLNVERIRVDI